jgi:hypothetical protein
LTVYQQSQSVVYRYLSGELSTASQLEELDYTLSPSVLEKTVEYSMLNVGAEAGMIYLLRGEKLAHKIGAGLSFQHGLKRMGDGETYNNAGSHYLSYELFYRNEYSVNKVARIFVQPFYRHTLMSGEVLNEPFSIKPYHAGLSFGMLYTLP